MTVAEDSLTASVTIALDANNYDFKVVVGGHWLGKDATYDIIDKSYGKGCEDESIKLKSTFALKNHQHNTDEIIYNNEILTNILKNILNKI